MSDSKYASAVEFSSSGSLYDDVDIEILESKTIIGAYPSSKDAKRYAFLSLKIKDLSSNELHDEILNAGTEEQFGADGFGFIPKNPDPKRNGLWDQSGVAIFNQSCIAAGYPAANYANGTYEHLKGNRFHLLRTPAPLKKDGTVPKNAKGYDIYNYTVSKWLSGSGNASASGGAGEAAIVQWITAKLAGQPAGIAQAQLFSSIVQEHPAGMDITSVGQYFTGDTWLKKHFNVNNGIVTVK